MLSLPATGQTVGGAWVVEARLGEGGMGAVFRVRHGSTGRLGALKLLLPGEDDPEARALAAQRLRDEGAAAARLDHPNLVAVRATGEDEAYGPFIVYELLPGTTLRELFATWGTPPSWDVVMEQVARPVLSGLAALHDCGVIHRDLKPENVFEAGDGSLKVGDLGLAVFEGRGARTRTGVVIGTPGYLAPERMGSVGLDAGPAVDVYAAAVLLVEAATGHTPFTATTPAELLAEQLRARVPASRLTEAGIPEGPAAVLSRASCPDPAARPADARALLLALEEAGTKVLAQPTREGLSAVLRPRESGPRPAPAPGSPIRPRVVVVILTALVLIGLLLALRAGDGQGTRVAPTGDDADLTQLARLSLADQDFPALLALADACRAGLRRLADGGTAPRSLLPPRDGETPLPSGSSLLRALVAEHYGDRAVSRSALEELLALFSKDPPTPASVSRETFVLLELTPLLLPSEAPPTTERWDGPAVKPAEDLLARATDRLWAAHPDPATPAAVRGELRLAAVRSLVLTRLALLFHEHGSDRAATVALARDDAAEPVRRLLSTRLLDPAEADALRRRLDLDPFPPPSPTATQRDTAQVWLEEAAEQDARAETLRRRISTVNGLMRRAALLPAFGGWNKPRPAATEPPPDPAELARTVFQALSTRRRATGLAWAASLLDPDSARVSATAASLSVEAWQIANDLGSDAGELRDAGWGPEYAGPLLLRRSRRILAALTRRTWDHPAGPSPTDERAVQRAVTAYFDALRDGATMARPPDMLSGFQDEILGSRRDGPPSFFLARGNLLDATGSPRDTVAPVFVAGLRALLARTSRFEAASPEDATQEAVLVERSAAALLKRLASIDRLGLALPELTALADAGGRLRRRSGCEAEGAVVEACALIFETQSWLRRRAQNPQAGEERLAELRSRLRALPLTEGQAATSYSVWRTAVLEGRLVVDPR